MWVRPNPWFIGRTDEFLNARGCRLIGWDEILEGGLVENATVMSWHGDEGGITTAKAGYDVAMAPTRSAYFDNYQFIRRLKRHLERLEVLDVRYRSLDENQCQARA